MTLKPSSNTTTPSDLLIKYKPKADPREKSMTISMIPSNKLSNEKNMLHTAKEKKPNPFNLEKIKYDQKISKRITHISIYEKVNN